MVRLKQWLFNQLFSSFLTKNYCSLKTTVELGANTQCYGNYFNGHIIVGDGAIVRRCELNGNVRIGRYSSLNGPNLDVYAGNGSVAIGNFCSIARNVSFQVDSHNPRKITTYLIFKNIFNEESDNEIVLKGGINVGHDVWIGSHSIILGNVTIGNGAIIAANSVVNNDVPPYAIVAGSPAKIIKYRFEVDVVDKLENLGWWDWDVETIRKNKHLFEQEITQVEILNHIAI